jgi:hypothetical protein
MDSKEEIGISLGWNCEAAVFAIENKMRQLRSNGYKTCPFEMYRR